MKKSLFLALALLLTTAIFSQDRTYIVNESFDSATLPYGWEVAGEGADNFDIKTTNNAGGDPNELHLKSSPFITNGIHLVMASANLTNVESVGMSFKHYLDNYQQSSTIGIATSSDNGNTWNTGWSKSYSGTDASGQYNISETFTTSDFGKDNVLFCLFFEGNTYNINHWYFDDIMIFTQGGNEEGTTDLQLLSIDVNSITQSGEIDIRFTVNNVGNEDITSFEASYLIEGYEKVTEIFETSLSPMQNQQLSFSEPAALLPDTYLISVEISSVNDGDDADESNNILTKEVDTYLKTVQRTPMIEHFSSSTCYPCVNVDIAMTELTENNPGKFTYTKYPMNIPGLGDPYFTDECLARADYYGINSVPCIAFDGSMYSGSITQTQLDECSDNVSYVEIIGAFNTEGNTINVVADIMSYINMQDVKVFFTVNEKSTTGNASTNGLTEFHHVVMKMLGGAEGFKSNLYAGQSQRYEFSYDMSETNMEEMNDLEVAAWIQTYDTKEVHNSSFLYEYTDHPYPAQNLQVDGNNLSWDAPQYGSPDRYDIYINNELIDNTTDLTYTVPSNLNMISVEIKAVYGDIFSVGITNITVDVCHAPQNVVATANENDISVEWDAVDGVTEYQLFRNGDFLKEVSGTSYTDDEIEHDVLYCYNLRSICSDNYSGFSETSCAQIEVSLNEYEKDSVIYPNPANDVVRLSTDNGQQTTVRIYNVMGILVGTRLATSETDEIEINISDYNPGVYFFNIQTEEFNVTKKIIVE